MSWRTMVRTAVLAGLLLTPTTGAFGVSLRSAPVYRLRPALPRLIEAVWRQLPWVTAPSETPTGTVALDGEAPEPSSGGSQDGEGGPGWDPDGLTAGTDDDSKPGTGSS